MQSRSEILDEAKRIVTRDRNNTYGEPAALFAAISLAWDALDMARGDRAHDGRDVALKFAVFKAVRASAAPDHMDSWIDGCGYFACGGEIEAATLRVVSAP
ncbi:hypothetical protein SAMN05444389_101425 [Paracoccus solventivorans]|uniref:DUF6378 domain-containing protein n=1 Tax=Paracoccus solventivorans TaxID=53463 RepID=A0A1M7DL52_9RHOB|nr:DUF6378 domain-containing protein [Paracoccus solventivorans]SHL80244.1 hypothetical protein SAMN05444389_101425 [Paracoccus solventivorans]